MHGWVWFPFIAVGVFAFFAIRRVLRAWNAAVDEWKDDLDG